jgi:type II secretory pathway component HofQ
VAAQLTGSGGSAGASVSRLLSPRGSAISETRTNQLFVTDVPAKLEQVQQLIAKLDIPVRQVLIEARIVEAAAEVDGDLIAVHVHAVDVPGTEQTTGQFGSGARPHGIVDRRELLVALPRE